MTDEREDKDELNGTLEAALEAFRQQQRDGAPQAEPVRQVLEQAAEWARTAQLLDIVVAARTQDGRVLTATAAPGLTTVGLVEVLRQIVISQLIK